MPGFGGDGSAGGTIYRKFTTRDPSTGAPTTLAGTPAVKVYKDDSTTESASGITLTVDFDSRTGLNHVTIDTSADGTFYANGHTFYVVITTGTVSGTSVVAEVVGEFMLAADFTSGSGVNVTQVNGHNVTDTTNGVLDVNAKNINNVSAGSVTTINANLGTTQPTNFTGTAGSALVKADAIDIASVAQTAGDVFNAVSNIAVTSAALNTIASTQLLTTGTDTGGTANTATLDGVFDTWTAAGNAIDGYYEFDISGTTGAVGVGVTWDGYLSGVVNTIKVYAYNWGNAAWDQIGTVIGIAGTVVASDEYELTSAHTGTGGNAGKVRIRFAQTGLTTGVLMTDRILLGYAVVLTPPAGWSSMVIGSDGGVVLAQFLANGTTPAAHGGPLGTSLATMAFSRMVGVSQTTNTAAWSVTGNGTAPGGKYVGGASNGDGLQTLGAGDGTGWLSLAGTLLASDYASSQAGVLAVGQGSGYGIAGIGPLGALIRGTALVGGNGLEIDSDNGDAIVVGGAPGKHDINLAGSGDILGNLAGRVLGTGSTAFAGVGVQADAREVVGTTIPELNAGQVAANFGEFYDVTPTSTKTINDVGGGGTAPTAAENAAAVWTDLLASSDFSTAASVGKLLKDDIDAAVSSRSTYAGGDTSGTTTLLTRLTSGRATNLDNLDAAVSSRSTYAGTDTAGTTTLLTRLTSGRATNLDNLDATVSSRGTYTGPPSIKKNTALAAFEFVMVLSSDHETGATGKTVTCERSIDGAPFAACANPPAEVSNGFYKVDFAASDLNGNVVAFLFTATGCDDTRFSIKTQS